MTRHVHRMPFGAQYGDDASAFRLWAPAAQRVDLLLETGARDAEHPMARSGDGWFACRVEQVADGARYAFRIDGAAVVPDPASRANPDGVHARSELVDPARYAWRVDDWRGRPWHEAVVYEMHVGAFTPAGSFDAAIARLDGLAALGISAVELMPIAAFPGRRNWGYDGVLPFAPAASYGTPDDLKRLVDAAHARGLMVLLDVVYNHFGPEGNYLHVYAPQFFNPRHRTPWGDAINFDGDASETVRAFFIHNALYWLEEFRFDGLRLDAVHAIADDSRPDFVTELAMRVRERFAEREVHLVLENDRNEARYLRRDASGRPALATAQWNDDLHHALHVIAAGEVDGYYADYRTEPLQCLGRALAEGFVYQGQPSAYREGAPRGEPSGDLPPVAFVAFAQNHDQIGNRALGERLSTLVDPGALRALTACVLLSPQVPLVFMGEEFAASTPFLFFCDFEGELAQAVTEGRRGEFARFARFREPSARAAIPDPNATATFTASKLDWREADNPAGAPVRAFHAHCLALRRRFVVPLLAQLRHAGSFRVDDDALLHVEWRAHDGRCLDLVAHFSPLPRAGVAMPAGETVFATAGMPAPGTTGEVPAHGVAFILGDR